MLNSTNTILLSADSGSTWRTSDPLQAAKINYSWRPVGGDVDMAIDGSLSENWYNDRLGISVVLHVRPSADAGASEIDADWLFDTFLPSKNKQFKESGGTAYNIVIDMKNISMDNWEGNRNFGEVTLKFLKKSVG